MAEIVNLRLARKQRDRAAAAREAEGRRALHGESKASRKARQAEADRAARTIDQHRREPD